MVRTVPVLVALLMRIWFRTCRVEIDNRKAMPEPGEIDQSPAIAAFYHYSILYVFYHLRKYPAAVMVSSSEDGDYIASLARVLGFIPVRGSRHNRGLGAMREMLRMLKQGRSCGIVADGSRGPARIVQPGAVAMASRTGVPVVPMAWSASRYFYFNSWDKTAIPMPFAKIYYHFGEPLAVPSGLDSSQLEEYRQVLETRLNSLYHQAWSQVGKKEH